MDTAFSQGFSYVVQNATSAEAAALSDQWVKSIEDNIEKMTQDMLKAAQQKNMDVNTLQGFMSEIWHKYTFNTDAAIHHSGNYAEQPDVNTFGSADVVIKSARGRIISENSLKSYGTASGSYRAQSETPWERYNALKNKALKSGKTYISYEEFLAERELKQDGTDKLSMYARQGKIIPSEQLDEAKRLLSRKISSLKGNTAPTPETSQLIQRYEEVLKTIDEVIKDGKGNSSLKLTHKQAIELAKAAKEGKIDEELLKKCGLDINKLVTNKDIALEALSTGLSAAAISLIISLTPTIVNAVSMLVSEGEIDLNALKAGGFNSISVTGKSFLSGSLSSAILTCCRLGKFGDVFKDISPMSISALVVVSIGTIETAIKCASGKIDKKEMAREIMQLYVTSAFSYAGGSILAIVCEGFPLAYMLGSLIGGIIGGLVYKVTENVFISFCIESGCTFFGLVDQDYSLPDTAFEELGLESFDFTRFQMDEFKYDRFEPNAFSHDRFEYEKFGIKVLRRDLIGVYRIGYS